MPKCDRCKESRSPFEDYRFWSGNWTERTDGGWEEYETLCNDCHRALVRNT